MTISCKDDLRNQQILSLASDVDKEGKRTIGVLTKADMIEKKTHSEWLPVLRNEGDYHLKLGYHWVVNPTQEELEDNITQEQAIEKEEHFFRTNDFFSRDALRAAVQERYGVTALRNALSRKLVERTLEELPDVKRGVDAALKSVTEQLHELPPPPSDPTHELFNRMAELSRSLASAVAANDATNMDFYRAISQDYDDLKATVLAARPKFQVLPDEEQSSGSFGGEEDAMFWLNIPAASEGNEEGLDGIITMDRVRQLAIEYKGRELPGFAPYMVLEVLVDELKGRWDEATKQCLQAVDAELHKLNKRLVKKHFAHFKAAQGYIREVLVDLQAEQLRVTQEVLAKLMAMEREQTWTNNDHYFISSKDNFLDIIKEKLYTMPNGHNDEYEENMRATLAALLAMGIRATDQDVEVLRAKKEVQAGNISDEALLEYIAGTLAYFKVSSKRVIDGVPMHINSYLLKEFCKQLDSLPPKLLHSGVGDNGAAAENGVGSNGAGRQRPAAEQLMVEDASVAELRAKLTAELEQLKEARRILSNI